MRRPRLQLRERASHDAVMSADAFSLAAAGLLGAAALALLVVILFMSK